MHRLKVQAPSGTDRNYLVIRLNGDSPCDIPCTKISNDLTAIAETGISCPILEVSDEQEITIGVTPLLSRNHDFSVLLQRRTTGEMAEFLGAEVIPHQPLGPEAVVEGPVRTIARQAELLIDRSGDDDVPIWLDEYRNPHIVCGREVRRHPTGSVGPERSVNASVRIVSNQGKIIPQRPIVCGAHRNNLLIIRLNRNCRRRILRKSWVQIEICDYLPGMVEGLVQIERSGRSGIAVERQDGRANKMERRANAFEGCGVSCDGLIHGDLPNCPRRSRCLIWSLRAFRNPTDNALDRHIILGRSRIDRSRIGQGNAHDAVGFWRRHKNKVSRRRSLPIWRLCGRFSSSL